MVSQGGPGAHRTSARKSQSPASTPSRVGLAHVLWPQHARDAQGERMTDTIATTTAGELEGYDDEGVVRFKGVPFAQPPVGALRFRPPQPVEPWAGVREAKQFGPTSL